MRLLMLLVGVLLSSGVLAYRRGYRLPTPSADDLAKWGDIVYFRSSEFSSPDQPGSGVNMRHSVVSVLDSLRASLGFPLQINSGYRTPGYNASLKDKGYFPSPDSAHLKGLAVDVHMPSLGHMVAFIHAARAAGVKRIGQYHTKRGNYFVHIDFDSTKPYQGEWYYRNGSKSNKPLVP